MIERCRSLFMVRSVGWKVIGMVVLLHLLLTSLVNLWLFPSEILSPIQTGSRGLITVTLLVNLLFVAIVFPVIFYFGKLKAKDLALAPAKGLGPTSIAVGLAWTGVAWLIVQCVGLVLALAGFGSLQFNDLWLTSTGVEWLGRSLGQFFGNAFYEEVIFRGFLIPQFLLAIKKRFRKMGWGKCLLYSLLASQLIFALIHIPHRINNGMYTGVASVLADQVFLFVAGLLLSAVFLLSRNLYAAIGVHALVNFTPMLIQSSTSELNLAAYLVIPVILAYNAISNRKSEPRKKS